MLYSSKPWLRVDEVARHLSLSNEMVYKLAQRGEIPAVKIGSSWRIPRDDLEGWLNGKREKSGTKHLSSTNILCARVIEEFAGRLKSVYGGRLAALYIYGSYARGTASAESDLDTLIVLKNLKDRWKEKRRIEKIAYDVSFGQGLAVVLSTSVCSEAEWKSRNDPLFHRIREEGKKAA